MAETSEQGLLTTKETARYRGGLQRTLVRTLVVFTFLPLLLMGGAAYLRSRALLRDQVVSQMRAQITDQVAGINEAVKTKEIRLDRLSRSPDVINVASQALINSGKGLDLGPLRETLVASTQAISPAGSRPTFSQYLLLNPAGVVTLSTKPEWEGIDLSTSPLNAGLTNEQHASFTSFDSAPLYSNELILLTVAHPKAGNGSPLGSIVGITESPELQTILQNVATPSSGAQALFVTENGTVVGTDPYTNQMAAVQAPESQTGPIMTALEPMMHQETATPSTVQFTDAQGAPSFGQVLWLDSLQTGIVYSIPNQLVFGSLNSLVPFTIIVILLALAAMVGVVTLGANRVFRPLAQLSDITQKFAAGDFTQRARAHTKDEIGLLARSFNHMAEQLSTLYGSLEKQVEERTRQIRTAGAVAQQITSTTNLPDLLGRTVQLLLEQFGFYQASIFVLDRTGRYAVLQASKGPAAREMLARGHRLEVGSRSIIGYVCANNKPRIASDVLEDSMHLKNELLPETRSEAGVPISAGGLVLGALDVQSTSPDAFGPATIVMLQTLSNQIAVAMQNMNMVESATTNLQEVERLQASAGDIVIQETRDGVLAAATKLLGGSGSPVLLMVVDGDRLTLKSHSASPETAGMERAAPMLESTLPELRAFLQRGAVVAQAGSPNQPAPMQEFLRAVEMRAAAFVPINAAGGLTAVLIVGSPRAPITPAVLDSYASVADLAAATMDRVAKTSDQDRLVNEYQALTSVGQAITRSAEDLTGFFTTLHSEIRKNIGEYAFVVAMYEPTTETISIPYAYEEGRVEKIDSFPLGEGLTSILIRTKQPLLLAEDVERQAMRMGAKVVGKPARSWMGVPLMVQDQAIGALILQDLFHERTFDEKHLRFFAGLAQQVSAVLYAARLLSQSRQHGFQLETAAEIARDISVSLDLDEVLSRAVSLLRERFGYHHAAVFLLDRRNENAVIREATGEAGAQMKRNRHKLGVGSRSIVGFVAGRGEPLIVNDTEKDATYYANPLLPDTRAEAAVPLRVGDRIVGVMDVQSTSPYVFQEDDVRTLQILADQLAVAVVNSELFAETQEHLSQHRLLHHITTNAASGTTLEEALEGAVTGLQVTMGGDRVSILLTEKDPSIMEIKAAAGYSEDIMQLKIPFGSGITGWSASHQRALRVDDVRDDPRYIEGSPNTRSELAVPLIYRNEVLGVLNVESEEVGAYTESDEEMLATLGGSLAAIISNARLLEQLRSQAERERILYEITGKIRNAPDMKTILETTASELTRVVGARRAQIRVSTEPGNGESENPKQ